LLICVFRQNRSKNKKHEHNSDHNTTQVGWTLHVSIVKRCVLIERWEIRSGVRPPARGWCRRRGTATWWRRRCFWTATPVSPSIQHSVASIPLSILQQPKAITRYLSFTIHKHIQSNVTLLILYYLFIYWILFSLYLSVYYSLLGFR